jgi:hypothetical protein
MRYTVLVATAMLATSVAHAQGSFEGVVTYQITTKNGTPMTLDYFAKGGKVRMQPHDTSSMGGMFGGMIIDMDAKTRTMIMPTRKMYMTRPIVDATISQHMDSSMRNTKLTKVGSEVVAGVPCDVYKSNAPGRQDSGTVCIAHGMGNFAMFGMGTPLGEMEQRIQGLSAAASGGLFPLKWTGTNDSMVATKVERKSLDAALFVPPAGYTQMQMPAGMRSKP